MCVYPLIQRPELTGNRISECLMTNPIIQLINVDKSYAKSDEISIILRGINLSVDSGEFVSIIGPSGSGKSTLLSIIAGLEEPSSGVIRYGLTESEDRLGRIGYMQQKDLLFPWRNVLDNALLGVEVGDSLVSSVDAGIEANRLIKSFGLDGYEHYYPHMLSGGMKQRVAFLRTMMASKDVILLDEPFGSLDALTRSNMQEWLIRLWGELDKTVILVTHDVEEAIILSDRIYMMTEGPGELFKEILVGLRRPRMLQDIYSQDFLNIKYDIMTALSDHLSFG